jgi:hypothetical protein
MWDLLQRGERSPQLQGQLFARFGASADQLHFPLGVAERLERGHDLACLRQVTSGVPEDDARPRLLRERGRGNDRLKHREQTHPPVRTHVLFLLA